MAKFHRFFTSFWKDPEIRRWPDHQKLLGSYLLTCPHRTSEGLFWLPHGYVAQDLGWSIERVSEGYSGLKAAGFCAYDDTSETVLLVKALKYEAPAGEKQVQGAINRLAEVPPTPLFSLLRDAAERYAPEFCKALDEAVERGILQPPQYPTDTPPEGYPPSSSSSSSNSSSRKVNTVVAQARPIDDTTAVFQAWQDAARKPRARLDDKRRRLIKAALKHYPAADLIDAVRGWRHSSHHCGQNDTGTVYNDLELLLRDSAHIEKFRDLERDGPPVVLGKATAQARTTYLEMGGGSGDVAGVDPDRGQAERQLPGPAG